MLLAIVGTRYSGKSEVQNYYVSVHSFISVHISQNAIGFDPLHITGNILSSQVGDDHEGNVPVMNNSLPLVQAHPSTLSKGQLSFSSALELLQYVTVNWQQNFVTSDLSTRTLVDLCVRRPFFMLLSVDAPLMTRFSRSGEESLEMFVQDNDRIVFGVTHSTEASDSVAVHPHRRDPSCLLNLRDLVNVHVSNSFRTVLGLHRHLETLDLLDPSKLRPGWDAYFMTLAFLASQRSNCMKRRVGAVLVRENRVVSTGYNGTPRGLRNCNEGGCSTCNATAMIPDVPIECVCLHAEENALLEAGRERVGTNAVLYCNTLASRACTARSAYSDGIYCSCPCLKCTIKIIQTGVKTVVIFRDDMSASLFQEAGVELRRHNPQRDFKLFPGENVSS